MFQQFNIININININKMSLLKMFHSLYDLCPSDYINRVRYGKLIDILYKSVNLFPLQIDGKITNLLDITDFDDIFDDIVKIISYELEYWDRYEDINDLFDESNNYVYNLVRNKNEQLKHELLSSENDNNNGIYEVYNDD